MCLSPADAGTRPRGVPRSIQPGSGGHWRPVQATDVRGVNIVTLAEGNITHLHIGFKGTMNASFLKDSAEKTGVAVGSSSSRSILCPVLVRRKKGVCANHLTIRREDGETGRCSRAPKEAVTAGVVEEFCREFAREMNPLQMPSSTANTRSLPGNVECLRLGVALRGELEALVTEG